MGGTISGEYAQIASGWFDRTDIPVLTLQQHLNAVIVRIVARTQGATLFELPAGLRCLQQQCHGEFGPVKVPIQTIAIAVRHDIQARHGIGHPMQ